METLKQRSKETFYQYFGTVAGNDMAHFMQASNFSIEGGLRQMINGLEVYCDALQRKHGTKAGDDGYLSTPLEDIAHSLIYLLSGPGRFDGGTIDKAIREICTKHGLNLE